MPPPLFRDNLAITGSGRVEDRDKTVRREQGIREAGASKGNDQARVAEQQGWSKTRIGGTLTEFCSALRSEDSPGTGTF